MSQRIFPGAEGHFSPQAMAVCLVATGNQAKNTVNPVNPV